MSKPTFSVSVENYIDANILAALATMMSFDDPYDDDAMEALSFVLDLFRGQVIADGWVGSVKGVEGWEHVVKKLRTLADLIDGKVAAHKAKWPEGS